MNFMIVLTCLGLATISSISGSKLKLDFEKLLGDSYEDCITTRKPIDAAKCEKSSTYHSIDGTCNNLKNPIQGSALTKVARFIPGSYAREDIPRGFPLYSRFQYLIVSQTINLLVPYHLQAFTKTVFPSPQEISDHLFQVADKDYNNPARVAHIFMTFGQFIDHDMVIIEGETKKCSAKPGCALLHDFKYPCNPILKSSSRISGCNSFTRSSPTCESKNKTRDQVNQLTSYIDGSMIYGSSLTQTKRVQGENGQLLTTRGDLLPFDPENERPCREINKCFLAGDIRVNENIALTSMHTVFLRLHNLYAAKLKQVNSTWKSDTIFEETRKIVIGILQNILYTEWLPLATDLSSYKGYNPNVDASINNGFASAAFRFGHSLVRNNFDQLDKNFNVARKPVPLRNAFNNVTPLLANGIEETIFGLMANDSQQVDVHFAEGIAKRLFIPPGANGMQNLAAINIQRGRDHGLPSYTEYRKFCKVGRKYVGSFRSFAREITSKKSREALQQLYKSVNNHIDLYPAGIAEKPVPGKLVGPTFGCIIRKQFENLRDGDRFYYERAFYKNNQLNEIRKMTLAKVLCLTLKGIVSIQEKVFERFIPGVTRRHICDNATTLSIEKWKEAKGVVHKNYLTNN